MITYILGAFKYLFYKKVSILAFVTHTSKVSKNAKIWRNVRLFHSSVGKYSYISPGTVLIHANVGKFCSIAGDCLIGLGKHTLSFMSTSPIFTEKKNATGSSWIDENIVNQQYSSIYIGNDVWIGARVMIVGGVTIGDGAVIGAGSIVTKNIPPYAIAVGTPARVIKYRFDKQVIDELLKKKWWDGSDEALKENITQFQKGYVDC